MFKIGETVERHALALLQVAEVVPSESLLVAAIACEAQGSFGTAERLRQVIAWRAVRESMP